MLLRRAHLVNKTLQRSRLINNTTIRNSMCTNTINNDTTTITSSLERYIEVLLKQYEKVSEEASSMDADNSQSALLRRGREMKFLSPVYELQNKRVLLQEELKSIDIMLSDLISTTSEEDKELQDLLLEDKQTFETDLIQVESNLLKRLVPMDEADDCDAILEVQAGAGGAEASLFTQEILEMYRSYAQRCQWKFEIISTSPSESGGVTKASAIVSSGSSSYQQEQTCGVYGTLKHENGVHRVQRVPVTETQGRVHTSAMTVLVMPQPADGDVDFKLNPAEVKVETTKASGAGGQHVNTTESAIRLTHVPTGITVVMQDERSQHRNKDKAFKVLRARLFERKRQEDEAQRQSERTQIRGHGDRSERIRTYNFPTDRISDHRITMTRHGLDNMMQGGDLFDEFNQALRDSEREMRLMGLLKEVESQ